MLWPSTPAGTFAPANSAKVGKQVHQVNERLALALRNAGAGDDERDVHAAELVEVLFAEKPVLAEREAVVAAEDDDRVVPLAAGFQLGEDAPDVMIEAGDAGVVVGELLFRVLGGARPGRELLIAHGHLAIVERMLRQEGGRERDFGGIVKLVKLRLGGARVVRDGRREVDVEWPRLVAGRARLEELDRAVGQPLAAMGAISLGSRAFGIIDDAGFKLFKPGRKSIARLAHVPGLIAGGRNDSRQECRGVGGVGCRAPALRECAATSGR